MKSIKSISLFSIFYLLSSTLLFSQDENYDAVYLQITKEYTLNPDGSIDYRYAKKQKLQTYRSFHSLYGETFIVYNPDYQTLKINDVHTIMADGKKVQAPANAFNEVLPGFAANAPAYNTLREMVITHPATERNAILNLDYQLHSNKGFYPAMMGNELIAENEPVKELKIKIKIPASEKLIFSLLNNSIEPAISIEGDSKIYTWTFNDLPAMSAEEFQKSGNDLYSRLIFSTAMDRETIYSAFTRHSAFGFQLSEEMKKVVATVLSENKDEMNIILKLQEKVVNEVRLWPVPLRYTGYTCRPAGETWGSSGGTLTEKAILLVALLKEAGIAAEPTAVIRKSLFDQKIGSLLDIEDMIVRVLPKSLDPVYLSVTNLNPQSLKYSLPGKMLVSLRPGEKTFLIQTTEYRNIISCEANLTIGDKQEIRGEISATLLNNCNPYLALQKDKSKMKSWFIPSSDLKDQKEMNPGPEESFARYSIQSEKGYKKDTNYYYFSLPYLTNGVESFGIKLLAVKRETAIEIPFLVEENYTIDYIVPEDMKFQDALEKIDLKNKAGSYQFEVTKSGKNIRVKRNISLIKRVIEPSEYADFKALMDNWNSEKYRKVIFSE